MLNLATSTWTNPIHQPVLHEGEVHIWKGDLHAGISSVERCMKLLDAGELSRAKRFRSSHDETRFIMRRGFLRYVLGNYLDCAPESLTFRQNDQGKPSVRSDDGSHLVEFNLSHSKSVVLIAVTGTAPVGIDVEYCRDNLDFIGIAERFFSPAESALLEQLDLAARKEMFYLLWTNKEALLKAIGTGLSVDLQSVSTEVLWPGPAITSHLTGTTSEEQRWFQLSFSAEKDYAAALVCREISCSTRYFKLSYE